MRGSRVNDFCDTYPIPSSHRLRRGLCEKGQRRTGKSPPASTGPLVPVARRGCPKAGRDHGGVTAWERAAQGRAHARFRGVLALLCLFGHAERGGQDAFPPTAERPRAVANTADAADTAQAAHAVAAVDTLADPSDGAAEPRGKRTVGDHGVQRAENPPPSTSGGHAGLASPDIDPAPLAQQHVAASAGGPDPPRRPSTPFGGSGGRSPRRAIRVDGSVVDRDLDGPAPPLRGKRRHDYRPSRVAPRPCDGDDPRPGAEPAHPD